MKKFLFSYLIRTIKISLFALVVISNHSAFGAANYVRVNQVGYLTADTKVAIAFSNGSLSALTFSIVRASDSAVVWGPTAFPASSGTYSPFSNTYKLDFSAYQPAGTNTYYVKLSDGTISPNFIISGCVYQGTEETVLNFYLAQRCGTDNKYAGAPCHLAPGGGSARMDGEVTDGPNVGTLLDTEGGWHDAGDYIKFMTTTGYACGCLLMAYRDNPSVFQDNLLANGTAGSNGIPDVLDEAKYALDWIIKMNPDANDLYYQVGDIKDHNKPLGTLPQNDNANYASKPYRTVYEGNYAGGSNNCGRAAACLAMAYQIWNASSAYQDTVFAASCLTHATQIYALGKANMHNQPATSNFYTELDWHADMEWAASEMYRATGNATYLADAKSYAASAGSGNGELDWAVCNFLAHYSLYSQVDAATQATLKSYMQSDVQDFLTQSNSDIYGLDTIYNWGTVASATGGILEGQIYDKLFGVTTYANMSTYNRDYMLGRNPWGVCFIESMGTTWPHHPQHNISAGLGPNIDNGIEIPGLPVEGPDSESDWSTQGITLDLPDAYAAFQSTVGTGGVYHDDVQDYATNEPTCVQAGLSIYVLSNLALSACVNATSTPTNTATSTSTNTPTATPTNTPTNSSTNTMTNTATLTSTNTPTNTSTLTPTNTITNTPTNSPTPTSTNTATYSPTNTLTNTVTNTPTVTSTNTITNTSTNTPTSTATNTVTNTPTVTPTNTVTNTSTAAPTYTPTPTPTNTATNTITNTSTPMPTDTRTNTPTVTPTYTATIPSVVVISEPYPNPSNGSPISFNVESPEPSTVTLDVFTLAFRKIASQTKQIYGPQTFQWDLKDASGAQVSNGLYYVRIQVAGIKSSSKILKVLILR